MRLRITTFLVTIFILSSAGLMGQQVSTLVNDAGREFEAIHWHEDGRILAVDYNNGRVYRVYTDGTVETIASGFSNAAGGGFDQAGNFYFSDLTAGTIHRLNANNTTTQIASGLSQPTGIIYSGDPDTLYVGQYQNNAIAKVSISSGTVTNWVSGNGLNGPDGIIYNSEDELLVANFNNPKIHKVSLDGTVTPYATIPFNGFMGYITKVGDYVYVASFSGKKLYRVDPDGAVTTIAGTGGTGSTDGAGTEASFSTPNGICSNPAGDTLLLTDEGRIRIITGFAPIVDAVRNLNVQALKINPNPARDFLEVSFESELSQPLQWAIYNNQGQEVLQDSLSNVGIGAFKFQINIQHLASDLYTLQLFNQKGHTQHYQFVRQ